MNKEFKYIEFPRTNKGTVHKMVAGKTCAIWVYPVTENAGDYVHCSASPHEVSSGYRGFQGYGGSTLDFNLGYGNILKLKAPWHSNSGALFGDTGVDLTDKHYTRLVLSKDTERGYPVTICKDIVYEENKPILGAFKRPHKIAREMVLKHQCDLFFCIQSNGGGSNGFLTLKDALSKDNQ